MHSSGAVMRYIILKNGRNWREMAGDGDGRMGKDLMFGKKSALQQSRCHLYDAMGATGGIIGLGYEASGRTVVENDLKEMRRVGRVRESFEPWPQCLIQGRQRNRSQFPGIQHSNRERSLHVQSVVALR